MRRHLTRWLARGEAWLMIACVALGIVAVSGAGVLDDDIQRDIRLSNVYVAPGVDVEEAAAERIVGNRNLVVVYLDGDLGDRGSGVCDSLSGIAKGSFVAILDEDLDMYGCSLLPGADEENLGKAYVAETVMRFGVEMVAEEKIQSARVLASSYDRAVAAGLAPQEAREIRAPFARYLVAAIALGTALVGSLAVYWRGRRLGHAFADATLADAGLRGRRLQRDAALASVGVRLLEADDVIRAIAAKPHDERTAGDRRRLATFERLASSYSRLHERTQQEDAEPAELDAQLHEIERLRDRFEAI
ncbi:cation:proton antiporter [Cumulibacter manganitolerans]|uniref:hypothetical protein n=1 Tax=Cumulibacter manganitolerans TaxID=1884992 RepID=UPI001297378D|nr:hypothetical protein [Cumulibacter manganitolerans]